MCDNIRGIILYQRQIKKNRSDLMRKDSFHIITSDILRIINRKLLLL